MKCSVRGSSSCTTGSKRCFSLLAETDYRSFVEAENEFFAFYLHIEFFAEEGYKPVLYCHFLRCAHHLGHCAVFENDCLTVYYECSVYGVYAGEHAVGAVSECYGRNFCEVDCSAVEFDNFPFSIEIEFLLIA